MEPKEVAPIEINDGDQFLRKAKNLSSLVSGVDIDDLYIVWFAKVLGNWKALVSTDAEDGMYFEVTYNGNKQEAYIDSYRKFAKIAIQD